MRRLERSQRSVHPSSPPSRSAIFLKKCKPGSSSYRVACLASPRPLPPAPPPPLTDGNSHLDRDPALPSLTDTLDSKPTHLDIDSPTTLSLALVSRSFHSQVDQVLYSHIRITRPSALLHLQRTLVSRPQLGRIMKSLWVGPDDHLKSDWWPLKLITFDGNPFGPADTWISASLTWLREEQLIPLWVRTASWPVKGRYTPTDCRGLAIHRALIAAQKDLNVDLSRKGYNHGRNQIEEASAAWLEVERPLLL